MSYYSVLQVSQTASEEEIKRAYQELVRRHHPDKSTDQSSEKFIEISQAFKTLIDPGLRRVYDSQQFQASTAHLIIHDTVTRRDFTYDEEEKVFYYQCKCGSFYTLDSIEKDSSTMGDSILSCDECSLNIVVKS